MQKLIAWIFSLPFLVFFSLIMLGFDLFMRICLLISPRLYDSVLLGLCRSVLTALKITGFSWHVEGVEHLDELNSDQPVVIVANHQSLMDIPMIILACQKIRPKFVAKEELANFIPFVSVALRKGGHAIINRSDRTRALRELRSFVENVASKQASICIFPEGTRARDGKIQNFKTAGLTSIFQQLENCQIVPLAISNSWQLARWKMMPVPLGVKVNLKILAPKNFQNTICHKPAELIASLKEEISFAQV